ncbi:Coiled-coil domain-containing protein 42 like protein [Chelonia mydas]|uniref:Coiled-coil domain-containing protein 42 like protein n=1 Tax=Chelonia mydas TaxID=8469 RepID=M7B8P7_CHEMY|nr:Coiled-coil domain-containing protein 42 like protein [Chelonia mydas]
MAFELEEYLRAAFRDKLLLPKMPEREDDYLTPATRLLEKRRELTEVEQALSAQREEFQMKMESLQQRRKELQHKEGQLKEAIFKFDKFLKDNDSKRSRALQKVSEQREQVVQKVVEAMQLRQEIARLLVERDRLQRHLEAHAIFRSYLQGVLEKTEQESKWTEIQNTATKKTLQLGQIKMATLNLFQLATKQMKLQVDVPLEDTETQLGTAPWQLDQGFVLTNTRLLSQQLPLLLPHGITAPAAFAYVMATLQTRHP